MDAMKKQSVENANIERASLAKTLGRGDVWALAFGSIVGWGWVMLAGSWVTLAGTVGAIIAFIVAIVFCSIDVYKRQCGRYPHQRASPSIHYPQTAQRRRSACRRHQARAD